MGPGQIHIVAHPVEGGVRLAVAGELDISNVGELRSSLEEHQGSGRNVLLDLSGLDFVDSAGLHLLLDAQADARRDGWRLTFASAVTPTVGRLLDLTASRPLLEWAEST